MQQWWMRYYDQRMRAMGPFLSLLDISKTIDPTFSLEILLEISESVWLLAIRVSYSSTLVLMCIKYMNPVPIGQMNAPAISQNKNCIMVPEF